MEVKVLIYIILGIGYFFYAIYKKAQEKKQEAQRKSIGTNPSPTPVAPPAYKSLSEIMKEVKQKQAAYEAEQRAKTILPQKTTKPIPQSKRQQESLLKEMKAAGEIEGQENSESASVKRQAIADEKKAMQSVYENTEDTSTGYELDARQALIGSIIFERKY